MKNLAFILILVFAVGIASAQETKKKTRKQKRAEREAKMVEQTKKLVGSDTWEFDADRMLPAKGRSRTLTTDYNVVLKDNKVSSYLPYFGRAYSTDYASTDSPMTFEAPIEDYSVEDGKKGGYIVKFSAKNKSDKVDFTFHISATGSTTLSVNSTNRQFISYQGTIKEIDEPEE